MAVPEEGLVSLLLNRGRVGTVYTSWQKATGEPVIVLCVMNCIVSSLFLVIIYSKYFA